MSVSGVMEYVKHKLDPKLLHKEIRGVNERPKVTSRRLSGKRERRLLRGTKEQAARCA